MEILLHDRQNVVNSSACEKSVELSSLTVIGVNAVDDLKGSGKSLYFSHIELIFLQLILVDLFLGKVFLICLLFLVEFLQCIVEFFTCLLVFFIFNLILGKIVLIFFKSSKILVVFFLIRNVCIVCLLFLIILGKRLKVLLSRLKCRLLFFVIILFLFKEHRLIVGKVYIGINHVCADAQRAGIGYGKCLTVACAETLDLSLICAALCGICEICGLSLNGRGGGSPGHLSARRGKLVFGSTY